MNPLETIQHLDDLVSELRAELRAERAAREAAEKALADHRKRIWMPLSVREGTQSPEDWYLQGQEFIAAQQRYALEAQRRADAAEARCRELEALADFAVCAYCGEKIRKGENGTILLHTQHCEKRVDLYERMLRESEARLATVRREALEEAAKYVVAQAYPDGKVDMEAEVLAAEIRALKEPETPDRPYQRECRRCTEPCDCAPPETAEGGGK